MTVSKRLSAHRISAVRAGATDEPEILSPENRPDEDECPETSKPKPKDSTMTEEEIKAAVDKASADAAAAATQAATQRFSAVLASEHYAGREKLAQTLLGNEAMSADAIIAALADAPKATTVAAELTDEQKREAAEAAGRAEMQAALGETTNSNIDADNGNGGADPKVTARAKSDAVWANAYGL